MAKRKIIGSASASTRVATEPTEDLELKQTGTGTLAEIEAGGDMDGETFDLDAARRALAPVPVPSQDDAGSATPEQATPEEAKRPRGRPKGSGKRRKVSAPLPGAEDTSHKEQELAETAAALGGTLQMMTAMWAGSRPERQGWNWTDAEAQRFGELWAVPLQPYMPALGAGAPWIMAAFGTGKLVLDKVREARAVAASVLPEHATQGGDHGSDETHRASLA